jgi:hypothetical protein
MRLPPKQCVVLTWWVSRFALLRTNQIQGNTGRCQTKVLCPIVFGAFCSCHMLVAALFLNFSVLRYCWQVCRHTEEERSVQVCNHQRFCVCRSFTMSRYSRIHTGLCSSLFSALCFSFADPGGRKLRERGKIRKKRKCGPCWSCSKPESRQVGQQKLPVPALGCYAL